jgi:acyl CoA:acetate/3-ketoacid CoA transferase beta subunit
VGVLGFIPGVTTQYSQLMFVGPDSHAMFLGLFQVSMLLNIVQLAIGATGWAMSRGDHGARNFLIGAGALYIILSIFGLSVGVGSAANFLSFNMTDNWTLLVLGVAMVVAGWLFSRNMAGERK